MNVFDRYGVPVPDDPCQGRVPLHSSLHEVCVAGVTAEVDNADLYDRLQAGTQWADILAVYRNRQEASQERHRRRCVERGGATDVGRGRQRRCRRRGGG